ncbi:TIGR02594 family protein [Rhodomicrobium vannielii ATCC 17100]|uniref:TIGR02594 family protein n=1 Tax=Rhodomicrobium vannielii TaxID=1069 RepID=UPI00191B5024|nr:TIGR02594 family protein [Rhodomicrobium vannielii]MBJ7535276.1 TIGR02594 family protein [Rhodomicrobium vannielii ATCC 17100]
MTSAWMQIAWGQLGVEETAGAKATKQICDYFAGCGHPDIASDEVPWCAAFVGWTLEQAGIRSTRSLMARSYTKFGTKLDAPRVGCIAVVPRGNDTSSGHVFFVAGIEADAVMGLGGNQSNRVSLQRFERSKVIAWRWPEPAKTKSEVSQTSRIAKAAGEQQRDATVSATATTSAPVMPAFQPDAAVQKAQAVQGWTESLIGFVQFAGAKWMWIAAAVALYFAARAAWNAARIRFWRTEDENTGATVKGTAASAEASDGNVDWQQGA